MPRDSDKNNDSRGRRDRGAPGKGRPSGSRGSDKPFGKRSFGGKGGDRDKRSFGDKGEGRSFRRREDGDAPRRDYGDRPRFKRDDRGGEGGGKRPFKPRGERRDFDAGDRPQRGGARSEGRSSDRKFGEKRSYGDREKRPYTPRGERDGEKRTFAPRGERAERKFDDRKFSRGDRDKGSFRDKGEGRPFRRREDGDAPRRDFGDRPRFKRDRDFEGRDRGDEKPWQKRDRTPRDGYKPRDDRGGDERPRFSRSREDRGGGERPRFSRSRDDREQGDRPKFGRPRWDRHDEDGGRDDRRRERPEGRTDWQEHPRSEGRFSDRPRRDNEDDSKVFAKRPAFGGRGAYRERAYDDRRERPEPKPKKTGERIAKVLARAGLASRRDAEEIVTQGRVTVNGRVINSPALDITENDVVAVDGKPLPPRERTRLFMYHKPRGLMTTHADPEGRPTVFDNLPEGLPRLISIGRLDFNTEGLLLLTNDGGLARTLEHPDTGWLRRYRVRAHGEVTQGQLDQLKGGVEVDGVKYGPIDATLERDQSANVWVVFAIREGKNREVRNVMAHLGLEVNRLIRISYGPFQLGELEEGKVEEVKTRVLREQLGEKIAKIAGADFTRPEQRDAADGDDAPARKPKPSKRETINDRKGRRVLVQRTGSEEARARNEDEANGYGPPRRAKRGYHGKRDLKPRDE
ncbi:23S rRNA pseudouridine2605 synthase [Bradyrhizobium sp. USDA 4524]|uniref:pseudouridine synthase n=1 Tax=unclassified Bradyrhizobium TaxID=2631580 RepID=UPI0020A154B9|nr:MULTISPECIES: pseudouridine synthase [unclassified Bradyrhizobium]MCP1839271.1 23S rRNA pseudouridine2605 synthase [Bradyrhizobium sp. USDA 4538]MCP1899835.1 23S rRNA pseudouridine2605 synthase [Bradyrhizobium sp. USDA 4537]MCP1986056.1 23S rRNA pseudouridine2605 synthase [Bradyrhizobium sp. USDA 4539]